MNTEAEDLRTLLDRDRIRQCLERMARGEDRRDGAMIKASCWPDSVTDYGVFKGDFDAYYAWVIPGADAITNTQHVLGQSYTELDGDTARVETHVVSYHRVNMGTEERDTCIGGRYLDVMAKRGGEWRIAERTMLYDWYQDWGVSIDWSQGVMGLPLSQEWFSGRANGDYSATFFAKGAK
ncbi:MAG TPA: nuclear transport factor 2 family protein [Novosphingobium sp.]